MKYQIIYHTDAENDIRNAKKWYKNQQTGLEKRFALALKETINYIIENVFVFVLAKNGHAKTGSK